MKTFKKIERIDIDIDEIKKELNLEEFEFSDYTFKVLYNLHLNKKRLLEKDFFDLMWHKYIDMDIAREIAEELNSKGYHNMEVTELSYSDFELLKLGYPSDKFTFPRKISLFIRRNELSLEKLEKISYEELLALDGVGDTKIREFAKYLDESNIKHSIILPPSVKEIKKVKIDAKEAMIEELLNLIIKESNLDLKNPIDKIIFKDYKAYINSLTPKKLEDKLTRFKSKLS